MVFHQNYVLVNFKLPRDLRPPNQQTSVIFPSGYLVPDTCAIYNQLRVIESV